MSPGLTYGSPVMLSFPRMRGDEPLTQAFSVYRYQFSPHARG